jgi:hypothetical protein
MLGEWFDSFGKSWKTSNAGFRKEAWPPFLERIGLGTEEKNGKGPTGPACLQQSQHLGVVGRHRITAHYPHIRSAQARFRLASNFMQPWGHGLFRNRWNNRCSTTVPKCRSHVLEGDDEPTVQRPIERTMEFKDGYRPGHLNDVLRSPSGKWLSRSP